MTNLLLFLFIFILSLIIAILWVKGIDAMKKYPDYKGEDFLNDYNAKDDNQRAN